MKKNFCLTITTFLVLFAFQSFAQTGAEKRIIATLGSGETLANDENCFLLNNNPESISFVTMVKSGSEKQYYCYGKDGKKTGPVKQPDLSYWADCKDIKVEDCIPNDEPNSASPEKYIDFSDGSVKFNGKKFGPFGQVMMFYLSADEQNFYAVALSTEMKIYFFDNSGRKIELNGIPELVLISPDGKKAYATIKGSINPFDPDAAQKMMNNPEEMNNPKINLIGIDGSKFGPYESGSFSDAWFIPSGQMVVYANSEISLDGKILFKSQEYISPCDIWISKNGKDYAWANYENIIFSDGTKSAAPLVIKYVDEGGKGYLKWISLENEKEVTFYKKVF